MESAEPSGIDVFLSYSRSDDEAFVALLHDYLLKAGLNVWFDRASMPSSGIPFPTEIQKAILRASRVALIIGPNALQSPYVTNEWQFALLEGKAVTPLLRKPYPSEAPFSRSQLPRRLRRLHTVDCRPPPDLPASTPSAALEEVARVLQERLGQLGSLHHVARFPDWYVWRNDLLEELIDAVSTSDAISVARTAASDPAGDRVHPYQAPQVRPVAIQGMGGGGKTLLAQAVVRDGSVRRLFPDGIFWVDVGKTPALSARQAEIGAVFGAPADDFSDERRGRERLNSLLGDKSALLILDDVWDIDHVRAFELHAPGCRLLLTTRSRQIASDLRAISRQPDLLSLDEALELLTGRLELPPTSHRSPNSDSDDHLRLVRLLGLHAQAIGLAAAWLKNNAQSDGDGFVDMTHEYLARLDRRRAAGTPFADLGIGRHDRNHNLELSLDLSYAALDSAGQQRFRALGAFAEGTPFDSSAAAALWAATSDDADNHLDTLFQAALLDRLDVGHYRQHMLLRMYARGLLTRDDAQFSSVRQRHETYYLDRLQAPAPSEATIAQALFALDGAPNKLPLIQALIPHLSSSPFVWSGVQSALVQSLASLEQPAVSLSTSRASLEQPAVSPSTSRASLEQPAVSPSTSRASLEQLSASLSISRTSLERAAASLSTSPVWQLVDSHVRSSDGVSNRLVVAALADHCRAFPHGRAIAQLNAWLLAPQAERSVLAARSAAQVAVLCHHETLLQLALSHRADSVRAVVINDAHQLWKDNPPLLERLLTFLTRQITFRRLLNWKDLTLVATAALNLSILVVARDYADRGLTASDNSSPDVPGDVASDNSTPAAAADIASGQSLAMVQAAWRPVIRDCLMVNRAPLLGPLTRQVRRALIGLLARITTSRLRAISKREYFTFSFEDVQIFFPASDEHRQIVDTLIDYIGPDANRSVEELTAYIYDLAVRGLRDEALNNWIIVNAAHLALLAHMHRAPVSTATAIFNLLNRIEPLYPETTDLMKPAARLWYLVCTFPYLSFPYADSAEGRQALCQFMKVSLVAETRYRNTWLCASGRILRVSNIEQYLFGYKIGVDKLGKDVLEETLLFDLAKKDHTHIAWTPYSVAIGMKRYQAPEAGIQALDDAISLLYQHHFFDEDQLSDAQLRAFWQKAADDLILYAAEYQPAFIRLIKRMLERDPPERLKTALQDTENRMRVNVRNQASGADSEDAPDSQIGEALTWAVRNALYDQDNSLRELLRWFFHELARAQTPEDAMAALMQRTINSIYGESIF